jgi:alpha-methylacyl-CoA racemase
MGVWTRGRGENLLDGGAPFYGTYECACGKFVSIGPLEPEFYTLLLEKLGMSDDPVMANPYDASQWPGQRERLTRAFAGKTRDEWTALLEGTDTCFAPVLTTDEAASHLHMAERGVFTEVDGVRQAAPAPRFSRTPGAIQGPAPRPGADTAAILADWGFAAAEIAALSDKGAFGRRPAGVS